LGNGITHLNLLTGTETGLLTRAAEKLGDSFKVEVKGWPGEDVTLPNGSEPRVMGNELFVAITGEGPQGDITRLRSEARQIDHERRSQAARRGQGRASARRMQ
jgi:hypothetical protein